MTKNKLEKAFSKSLQADTDLWGMKLHNNMLAHQITPADYIISYNKRLFSLFLHLVECKQVTCKMGKGRFAFKRLHQRYDLENFENHNPYHHSWVCLAYWDGRWSNSEVYLIPINAMASVIDSSTNMSMNRIDAKLLWEDFRIPLKPGSIFDLSKIKS